MPVDTPGGVNEPEDRPIDPFERAKQEEEMKKRLSAARPKKSLFQELVDGTKPIPKVRTFGQESTEKNLTQVVFYPLAHQAGQEGELGPRGGQQQQRRRRLDQELGPATDQETQDHQNCVCSFSPQLSLRGNGEKDWALGVPTTHIEFMVWSGEMIDTSGLGSQNERGRIFDVFFCIPAAL